jgi:hypothetical protein
LQQVKRKVFNSLLAASAWLCLRAKEPSDAAAAELALQTMGPAIFTRYPTSFAPKTFSYGNNSIPVTIAQQIKPAPEAGLTETRLQRMRPNHWMVERHFVQRRQFVPAPARWRKRLRRKLLALALQVLGHEKYIGALERQN